MEDMQVLKHVGHVEDEESPSTKKENFTKEELKIVCITTLQMHSYTTLDYNGTMPHT
jgi:hypothetical protein